MSKTKATLAPRLRFPEFISADEWGETTLEKLADFRRGSFPQPYGLPVWYDEEYGMPFIQVFDVGEDLRIKPKTKSKISALAAKQSVFIPKGTVIITIQGSIGRVAITQYDAYIDRTLLLFEKFHREINKIFIAYILQMLFDIEKQKAPGGIIKTITKEVLSDFKVKIPDIKEQQKIADCLSSLDDLIAAENKKLEALKTHKKGLMQKLFNQEVCLKDKHGIRFPVWRKKTLEDICLSISSGKSKKGDNINGFPLYGSTGIIGKTDIAEYDGEFLLVARVGSNAGNTYIINERCGISDNTLIIDVDKEKVVLCYLGYFLRNYDLNKLIFGSGQPLVTSSQLKAIELQLPSLSEQQKISDFLSSIDDLITAQAEKINALKLHKKGLMQGLFPSAQEVFR